MLAHVVACLWWGIGTADFNLNDSSSQGQIPWTQRVSRGGYKLNWDSPFFQRYLTCFYWAVTTLVKVPFTIPRTNGEQIFTFFFIWVGAISFAVIIGEVTAWVATMRAASMARGDALGRVRKFCVTKKVPDDLQKKAYAWIVANQDYAGNYAGKPVLGNLSGKIRTEARRTTHPRYASNPQLLPLPSLATHPPTACSSSRQQPHPAPLTPSPNAARRSPHTAHASRLTPHASRLCDGRC